MVGQRQGGAVAMFRSKQKCYWQGKKKNSGQYRYDFGVCRFGSSHRLWSFNWSFNRSWNFSSKTWYLSCF